VLSSDLGTRVRSLRGLVVARSLIRLRIAANQRCLSQTLKIKGLLRVNAKK